MKNKFPLFIIAGITLLSAGCKPSSKIKHNSPKVIYPGLFQDVQSAHVFADSKTFADCIAKEDPEKIIKT